MLVRKGAEAAAVGMLAVMALLAAALQTVGSALAAFAGLPVHGAAPRLAVVAATWLFDVGFVLVVYLCSGVRGDTAGDFLRWPPLSPRPSGRCGRGPRCSLREPWPTRSLRRSRPS